MKRVLVVYYTQSGQLKEIIDSVLSPLTEVTIDFLPIDTATPFPFPWTDDTFFDAFPESYLQIPQPLQPFNLPHTDYDLVILGYQVWYLSPSIPFNSFLQHPEAKKLLSGKPVITISGTRNMWVMAHQKVKKLLTDCGVHLVGNIALTDPHHNHISVITIVQWLFSGDKNKRYLGVFRKFYWDTALSASPAALPSLLAVADHSHITYGSDWPFAPEAAVKFTASDLTCRS